jgi:RNA polymerase subunit RPABC4/transcription elongation factor Spt4
MAKKIKQPKPRKKKPVETESPLVQAEQDETAELRRQVGIGMVTPEEFERLTGEPYRVAEPLEPAPKANVKVCPKCYSVIPSENQTCPACEPSEDSVTLHCKVGIVKPYSKETSKNVTVVIETNVTLEQLAVFYANAKEEFWHYYGSAPNTIEAKLRGSDRTFCLTMSKPGDAAVLVEWEFNMAKAFLTPVAAADQSAPIHFEFNRPLGIGSNAARKMFALCESNNEERQIIFTIDDSGIELGTNQTTIPMTQEPPKRNGQASLLDGVAVEVQNLHDKLKSEGATLTMIHDGKSTSIGADCTPRLYFKKGETPEKLMEKIAAEELDGFLTVSYAGEERQQICVALNTARLESGIDADSVVRNLIDELKELAGSSFIREEVPVA